jgi:hypothetical protein
MENFLREILAPSPVLSPTALPVNTSSEESSRSPSLTETSLDWEGEQEMQRLLNMLPDVQPDMKTLELNFDAVDFPSSLDLELNGWDLGSIQPPLVNVGAF